MSYNVGIQNKEIVWKNWKRKNGKYNKLKEDVRKTFAHGTGIQILLISEFGHMFQKLSNAKEIFKELFTTMLAQLDLTRVHLEVMPPYVALIDKTAWRVTKSELMTKLCENNDICVHHLVVQHVDSGAFLRIFNAHIPTSVGTTKRKEACVKTLCRFATCTHSSGVAQPTPALPWLSIVNKLLPYLGPWLVI